MPPLIVSFGCNTMLKIEAFVVVITLVGSCSGDGGALQDCPGERPTSLSSCFRGDFFADCGGNGDPKLACREGDGCLWFTADCAPTGYLASDCPVDDVCCHSGWPFKDHENDQLVYDLNGKIAGLGQLPWDRTRETILSVTIDSSLSGSTAVNCTTPLEPGYTPCAASDLVTFVTARDTVVVRSSSHGSPMPPRSGWDLWIEIIPDAVTGDPSARMCKYGFTDLAIPSCQRTDAICATAGSLVLNQWPISSGGLVASFDATFDNGLQVSGVLAQ